MQNAKGKVVSKRQHANGKKQQGTFAVTNRKTPGVLHPDHAECTRQPCSPETSPATASSAACRPGAWRHQPCARRSSAGDRQHPPVLSDLHSSNFAAP